MFFISPAWAQAATTTADATAAAQGTSPWFSMVPLVIIFALFYILIIRPQSKRIKEHGQLLETLKPGDKVITGGGLHATIIKVLENDLMLEIASGIHVKAQKHTITTLQDAPPVADIKPKKK